MKKLLLVVLVLAVGVGALGYWRGWFSFTKEGVHVEREKFTQDTAAFSKTVKDKFDSLWTKSEGLTGDEKAHAQKELGDLKKQNERLEQQIKELEGAGQDKFESIKQDLSKTRADVELKIEKLEKKLKEKEKGK